MKTAIWNTITSLLAEVSHDEANWWNERRETSSGFRWVSYHACSRVSLTTSDVFVTCDNPENQFEFERERERLLNLSARSNLKWTNQSWGRNDLASSHCRGPHPLRKAEEANLKAKFFVLHESFNRRSTRIWSEIYWALWNCWFYCDSGLFFLRRKRLVEWRLASDGWFPC